MSEKKTSGKGKSKKVVKSGKTRGPKKGSMNLEAQLKRLVSAIGKEGVKTANTLSKKYDLEVLNLAFRLKNQRVKSGEE